MTNQQMIDAILQSIQNDAKLLTLMRASIAQNLPNLETARLQILCAALGISTSG